MSTVREVAQMKLSRLGLAVTDQEIDVFAIESGVTTSDQDYSKDLDVDMKKIIICAIPELLIVKSESEGGYSKSFNTDGIKAYYSMICKECGVEDQFAKASQPKIKNKSFLW